MSQSANPPRLGELVNQQQVRLSPLFGGSIFPSEREGVVTKFVNGDPQLEDGEIATDEVARLKPW